METGDQSRDGVTERRFAARHERFVVHDQRDGAPHLGDVVRAERRRHRSRRHATGCQRDELQRPDFARPPVDPDRDLFGSEVGDRPAVGPNRGKADGQQIRRSFRRLLANLLSRKTLDENHRNGHNCGTHTVQLEAARHAPRIIRVDLGVLTAYVCGILGRFKEEGP
jgi:hypothetical protein